MDEEKMTRWSEEQFNEWAKRKRRESLVPVSTESKYHNIPTEIDGIKFDSKRESRRYLELKAMEKAGMINDLWIEREDWYGDIYYDCSVCGESFVLIDGTPSMNSYHYCPNCGAKMEK